MYTYIIPIPKLSTANLALVLIVMCGPLRSVVAVTQQQQAQFKTMSYSGLCIICQTASDFVFYKVSYERRVPNWKQSLSDREYLLYIVQLVPNLSYEGGLKIGLILNPKMYAPISIIPKLMVLPSLWEPVSFSKKWGAMNIDGSTPSEGCNLLLNDTTTQS